MPALVAALLAIAVAAFTLVTMHENQVRDEAGFRAAMAELDAIVVIIEQRRPEARAGLITRYRRAVTAVARLGSLTAERETELNRRLERIDALLSERGLPSASSDTPARP